MKMAHPMMPVADHDEAAEQLFVRDFKIYLSERLDPAHRDMALAAARRVDPRAPDAVEVAEIRDALLDEETYGAWLTFRRSAQELMWDVVGRCVDRQIGDLNARARVEAPKGSVTLDPAFEAPPYIKALDIHMMPGGYLADEAEGDVRQGAIMDRGGAVFLLGRNGGLMNDGRGHTLVSHLFECHPTLEPRRILDLGCGVGPSTVAVASYFPDAEHHGIDVGGAMLRYAHARAEHLGATIHFSQQSAEATRFADESFDLVYSCVLVHETSDAALPRIMAEANRVLRPGGVMIHLEVPLRHETVGLWGRVLADFESLYNNEPFWRGATSADFRGLMEALGLEDIRVGYQAATTQARRGGQGFTETGGGVFGSWYVASGRKPART